MESTLITDWSELPNDILEHLTSFFSLRDCLRFGVVCRNWFSVAKQRRHPPRQLPWLVMGEDEATSKHNFFSIEEDRDYLIDIPELRGQWLCGSSYGWLFTLDIELNFCLLNPFTKKCYNLPPLLLFDEHHDITKYEKVALSKEDFTFEDKRRLVSKAILDCDPSRRSDFNVLVLYCGCQKLAYWNLGDSAWTQIQGMDTKINDIIFFKENFYAVGALCIHSDIYVVNVGSDPKIKRVGPKVPDFNSFAYLVDYMGHLLLVQRCHSYSAYIIINKIDIEEEKYSKYKAVDGPAVFIGANSCMTVDPSKYPRCEKNALYLTVMPHYITREYGSQYFWIYDMADPSSFSRYYSSEPDIRYLAFPIWLIPNLQ